MLAVNVTVSPDAPPVAPIVGVLSAVLLSVDEVPLSEPAARSTAVGADGAVVSTTIDRADPATDVPPVGWVSVAVIDHVPAASVPRVQLVAGTTYVQETLENPDLVAVTVMVFPDA